jgi:hypothetical protein
MGRVNKRTKIARLAAESSLEKRRRRNSQGEWEVPDKEPSDGMLSEGDDGIYQWLDGGAESVCREAV